MRALSATELLAVWERGLALSSVERALVLLGAACAEWSSAELARLSVGRRDALLLTLREWTFGPHLTSLADCPGCGERLELNLTASGLRVESGGGEEAAGRPGEGVGSNGGGRQADAQTPPEESMGETLELEVGGYAVSFRPPNSIDLFALAGGTQGGAAGNAPGGLAVATASLLARCVVAAHRGGEQVRAEELPAEVTEAIAARMAAADPQAEVQLDLKCPSCGEGWQSPFDIESFFWGEINAWAQRVLNEVHVLASAYGWREADILNMSASRRQCYLDLIGG